MLDNFIKQWDGKYCKFPTGFGGQCMDLWRTYVRDVLTLLQSRPVRGAVNVWTTYLKDEYNRFEKTPLAIPKKGDVIIWGTGYGPYGHIAIFVEGNLLRFKSFDQNSPLGSVCHIQSHSYRHVLGWIRPKTDIIVNTEMIISDDNDKIDFKGFKTEEETYGILTLQTLKSKILAKDTLISSHNSLKKAFKKATGTIFDMGEEINQKNAEIKALKNNKFGFFTTLGRAVDQVLKLRADDKREKS